MPVRDGVATVRLDEPALAADDQAREQMSAQIVWTLKQLPEVRRSASRPAARTCSTPGVPEEQNRDPGRTYDPDDLPGSPSAYVARDGRVGRYLDGAFEPVPGAARHRAAGAAHARGVAGRRPGGGGEHRRQHRVRRPPDRRRRARAPDQRDRPVASRPGTPAATCGSSTGRPGTLWYLADGADEPQEVAVDRRAAGSTAAVVARDGARVALVVGTGRHGPAARSARSVRADTADGGQDVSVRARRTSRCPTCGSPGTSRGPTPRRSRCSAAGTARPVAPFYVDIDGYDVVDVEPLAGPGEHHGARRRCSRRRTRWWSGRPPASCCSSPRAAAGSRSAPAPTRPTRADDPAVVPRPALVHRLAAAGLGRPAYGAQAGRVPSPCCAPCSTWCCPADCAGCGTDGVPWCPACAAAAGRSGPAVPSRPVPAGLPPTWAVAAYDGAVAGRGGRAQGARRAGADPAAGGGAGAAVVGRARRRRRVPATRLLVPAPSRAAAVRERGHDPTLRLARCAARCAARRRAAGRGSRRCCGWPGRPATRPGSASQARAENLAGAVRVPPRLVGPRSPAGRSCWSTTSSPPGATLAESARALRAAGAVVVGGRGGRGHRHVRGTGLSLRHLTGTSVPIWHPPGSVVAPDRSSFAGQRTGKPMPAAGETVHVRRLLVVRSRCGLEVSPAPPEVQMSSDPGEGE